MPSSTRASGVRVALLEIATKSFDLNCSAWFGERLNSLSFPDSWELDVIGGPPLPALSDEALLASIRHPVSGPPLVDLARSARSAAIIIDDITRPTPTARLLPLLLEELTRAGMTREDITVFVAGGTHGVAGPEEIKLKLGAHLAGLMRVVAHDMRASELRDLGHSSRGTPILANEQLLGCDLKLGIGGLYPHPAAGFSGGSKLIAPGLCGLETAKFLHDNLGGNDWRGRPDRNAFRSDIDEIAGRIGLAFVTNVVLNFDRQVAAVFAGERMAVQREGIEFVRSVYSVPSRVDADVVIADAYPFDTDFHFACDRATWPLASRPTGAAGVLLASCLRGAGGHEFDLPLGRRITNRVSSLRLSELRRLPQRFRNLRGFVERKRLGFHVVSENLCQQEVSSAYPRALLMPTWESTLEALSGELASPGPRVALYRCAPLLVPTP
jgi:lactate racemase